MELGDQAERDEATQHHDVALGEVHHLGRFVDQHEAERDQPVDTTGRRTVDDKLQYARSVFHSKRPPCPRASGPSFSFGGRIGCVSGCVNCRHFSTRTSGYCAHPRRNRVIPGSGTRSGGVQAPIRMRHRAGQADVQNSDIWLGTASAADPAGTAKRLAIQLRADLAEAELPRSPGETLATADRHRRPGR